MKKLERIKIDRNYLPILALIVIELLYHAFFLNRLSIGDDLTNQNLLSETDLISFSVNFYNTWSSRIIINGLIPIFAYYNIWLWRILDVGMIALFVWSVSEITVTQNKYTCNCVITALFLLYPFTHQVTAGWVTTTISYLWPLSLGAYSCVPMKKALSGQKIHWWEYVLCGLAALFSCNAEQNAVIMLVVSVALLAYAAVKKKKRTAQALVFAVATASLIFHLSCPGNAARNYVAIAECDPDFLMLTTVEKLQLGFSETVSKLIFSPNLIFTSLLLLLAIVVLKKRNDIYSRVVVLIPLSFCVLEGYLPDITARVFPDSAIFPGSPGFSIFNGTTPYPGLVTISNCKDFASYIPFFVMAFCVLSVAIGIYISMDGTPLSLLAILVYLCGIGGGMIMGFSPTLYASSLRPYTVVYGCMIVVIVMIFNYNTELISHLKLRKAGKAALYGAAAINFACIIIQSVKILDAYVRT